MKKNNNSNNNIIKKTSYNDILTLDKMTENFFPKDGSWWGTCFNRPEETIMSNLPCHLRDIEWLSNMLKIYYYNQKRLSIKLLKSYVVSSELFNKRRHDYELEIVKWQIEWILSNGEGWITDSSLGGDLSLFLPNCDIAFRKGVKDTLLAIGINEEAIEEGLEIYSNLWRQSIMDKAFLNHYMHPFGSFQFNLEDVEPNHKELWLMNREYEYYICNKESVDRYSIPTPSMKISNEELLNCQTILEEMNQKRLNYIKKCKDNHNKILKLSI